MKPLINIVTGQKLFQVLGCSLCFRSGRRLCRLCKYSLPFSGGEDTLNRQLGRDNGQNLRMLLDFGEKESEDEIKLSACDEFIGPHKLIAYHPTVPAVLAEHRLASLM